MKRIHKILWGAVTPMPIILIVMGVFSFLVFIFKNLPNKGMAPSPEMPGQLIGGLVIFYALILLGIFLGFLVHISYFIHLVRKEDMTKDIKTLWVVLFLVLNIISMIVYWFMVVLPEPEPGQATEEEAAAPVKRTRRK